MGMRHNSVIKAVYKIDASTMGKQTQTWAEYRSKSSDVIIRPLIDHYLRFK